LASLTWLYELDHALFRAIHVEGHRTWLDPIFWVISTSGLGYVQALLVLLLPLLFSRRFRDWKGKSPAALPGLLLQATVARWRDPAFVVGPMLATILVAGLGFSGLVKRLLPRERPSHLEIAQPQEGFLHMSYPSGHTTTAFAVAFMLLFLSWDTPRRWIGPVALVWAALVGLSRIYRGVHWPTDVLGGMFAGLVGTCIVYLTLRMVARRAGEAPAEGD
jgi:membrane-associated phospholipid phosphatase